MDEADIDNRDINPISNRDVWFKIKNQIREQQLYSEMEKDNLNNSQKN